MELKSDITELKKAIPIEECRKILGDWDSTDEEIEELRDNLEILVNFKLNEVFNANGKAVIYCRVSSKKQEKDGNGLASQETRYREWCKHRSISVEKVFSEKGISGSQKNRPALFDMFEFLDSTKEKHTFRRGLANCV